MTEISSLTYEQCVALEARAHQIRAEALRYGFRAVVKAIRGLFAVVPTSAAATR